MRPCRRPPYLHCLERTLIITDTPPNGVQFSHPLAEQAHNSAPTRHDAPYENLFHEPEFAPGTAPEPFPEPVAAPVRHRRAGRSGPQRSNRRRTAA